MKLYNIQPVEYDFFYLAECICVSSTLLCESIVPSFLLLTSFQLCGYTTVLSIHKLIDRLFLVGGIMKKVTTTIHILIFVEA